MELLLTFLMDAKNGYANKPLWTESTIVWLQTKSQFLNIVAVKHTDLRKFTQIYGEH